MNALTAYLAASLIVAMSVAAAFAALWFNANRVAGERWTRVRFLKTQVTQHRRQEIRLSAECGQLRERVTELLDERAAAATEEPSLTESVYADLASLPITSPDDDR